MATYTHRETISRRIEYIVPAAQPWGAFLGDVEAAIAAATAHYIRENRVVGSVGACALQFVPRDDEIVIHFTIEERA